MALFGRIGLVGFLGFFGLRGFVVGCAGASVTGLFFEAYGRVVLGLFILTSHVYTIQEYICKFNVGISKYGPRCIHSSV